MEKTSRSHRRFRKILFMILGSLLAFCLSCGALVYFLAPALTLSDPNRALIPVTGLGEDSEEGDQEREPTVAPGKTLDPTPEPVRPTPRVVQPTPAYNYRSEAENRLAICYDSFHEFYLLEEMAIENPELIYEAQWRIDINGAMDLFRKDCEPLGSLPDAPPRYIEADHWFKRAAAEVGPAADKFSTALDTHEGETMQMALRHIVNFIEYTHMAEKALTNNEGLLEG